MLVEKKTNIYFAAELSLKEISFIVYVHALMTQKSYAVGMRNHCYTSQLKYVFRLEENASRVVG